VAESLTAIVQRALSLDPRMRYSSADELRTALREAVKACPPELRKSSLPVVHRDAHMAHRVMEWESRDLGIEADPQDIDKNLVIQVQSKQQRSRPPKARRTRPPAPAPDVVPAAPAPALAAPAPAMSSPAPAPAMSSPVPAAESPAPAPAVSSPAPAVSSPAPAVSSPAPAVSSPAPAVSSPAPAVSSPAPAPESPAPAMSTLAPAAESPAPAPAVSSPAPVFTPAPLPVIAPAQPLSVETSPAPEPLFAGSLSGEPAEDAMAVLADLGLADAPYTPPAELPRPALAEASSVGGDPGTGPSEGLGASRPPVVVAKLGPSPYDSPDSVGVLPTDATLPDVPPTFGDAAAQEPFSFPNAEPLGAGPILVEQESAKKRTGLWIVLIVIIAILVGVIVAIALLMASGCEPTVETSAFGDSVSGLPGSLDALVEGAAHVHDS